MGLLARNVKRLREARGLSQRELGEKAGTTAVAMIENGKRPNTREETLAKLARALGVPVAELFVDPDDCRRPHRASRRRPANSDT